jgi:hypothetical protein
MDITFKSPAGGGFFPLAQWLVRVDSRLMIGSKGGRLLSAQKQTLNCGDFAIRISLQSQPKAAIARSNQEVRIAIPPSEVSFNSKRSYEFVVSNENKYKKYNQYGLMFNTMTVKKIPVPVMSNIHDFIGKSN